MPIETILLKGETIEIKKTDRNFSGTWEFKFGFTRVNGKFAIRRSIKGGWEINKIIDA